jgi:hypothetical protein
MPGLLAYQNARYGRVGTVGHMPGRCNQFSYLAGVVLACNIRELLGIYLLSSRLPAERA